VKPIHILFWLAIGSPLLALIPSLQDPADTDWGKEVERACTAQRYGLRLAAAKKVAGAGAAAVPAVKAYAEKKGKNELPATLVEAFAEQTTTDAAVHDLLLGWATDRDFYWRATALRGIAKRAPLWPERREALQGLFTEHQADPAWLVRVHARLGSALLGEDVLAQAESDPRAVSKLTALLLQHGKLPPLQPLFDALVDDRTTLGDPWGQRRAKEAHQALKAWLGEAHPLPDGEAFADRPAAVAALLAAASRKSGQQLQTPAALTDPATAFTGGFEILSCRSGDQFVQWTDAGELRIGIDGATAVQVPAETWAALSKERAELALSGNLGVVVCDSMRLQWGPPAVHVRVAPGALPEAPTKWFLRLAQTLAAADQPRLADALRTGLEQFGPR
jgi:hypothetical protein